MKEQVRELLARYEPQRFAPDEAGRPAAVLMLLYHHNGIDYVVLQKRTDRVQDHKGQISFPGGAAEAGDADLCATALRETYEEIGATPSDIDIVGRLDDVRTLSRYRISPFVGWLDRYPYEWRISVSEVAYLLEVPLPHLLDPSTSVEDVRIVNGRNVAFPAYRFGENLIWGATARMLANFLDVCAVVPDFGRH